MSHACVGMPGKRRLALHTTINGPPGAETTQIHYSCLYADYPGVGLMKTPDSFPFFTTSDRSGLAPIPSFMAAELDGLARLPVVQKRISTTEFTETTEAW